MKKKILESLYRMKEQAKKNVEDNVNFYVMHSPCALEFADMAIKYLENVEAESSAPTEDGYMVHICGPRTSFKGSTECFAFIGLRMDGGFQSKKIINVVGDIGDAVLLYSKLKSLAKELVEKAPEIVGLEHMARIQGLLDDEVVEVDET